MFLSFEVFGRSSNPTKDEHNRTQGAFSPVKEYRAPYYGLRGRGLVVLLGNIPPYQHQGKQADRPELKMVFWIKQPASVSDAKSSLVDCTFNTSYIDKITFGKYHKVHVCNLKEFKVYSGTSQSSMREVLHAVNLF